ncbi:MAG: P pilus assembly chaperone PapD [Oleispira sp.]|jgi:P pilus assembly chaperone PapD
MHSTTFVTFVTRLPPYGFSMCRVPAVYLACKGLLLFCLLLLLPMQLVWADLMLNPTRVVLENNQRSAKLDLINNGQETATYRISLVNRRMGVNGGFTAIDSPLSGEQFADSMLRYSPRQVVLAAGEGQTVRIMVRKPADLAAGEYRSHLMFTRVPKAAGASDIETQGNVKPSEVSIKLTVLIGASIPVIVRHGDTSAAVTLTNLTLLKPAVDQPPVVAVVLERSGNRSVYGDMVASFTPHGGAEQVIGKAGGVAVYTPNASRRFRLTLQSGLELAHGTLSLSYRERPDAGGKLLAQTSIQLP